MKNKIATGLGLALSLTVGVCFADSLGGSNGEVNVTTPFTLPLIGLSTDTGKYYTVTCSVNNIHNAKHLKLKVALDNGSLSPVLYDGKPVDKTGLRDFTVDLADGEKFLVLQKVHAASKDVPIMIEHHEQVNHPTTEVIARHWFWADDTKQVDHWQDEVTMVSSTKTENDQLTFSAEDKMEVGSGYLVKCDRADDFITPNSTPVVAQPDSTPVVAQPDSTPVVAQPDSTPVVAQPDSTPVVAQPDSTPVVAQPDSTVTSPSQ